MLFFFFFFNDTATTEIYTLSLHDALPIYAAEVASFGDLLDGEIELVAGDEIDRRRRLQALLRLDGDLCPDHADLQARLERLERLGGSPVHREPRGRGGPSHKIAAPWLRGRGPGISAGGA